MERKEKGNAMKQIIGKKEGKWIRMKNKSKQNEIEGKWREM